jgi:hypothetical protein
MKYLIITTVLSALVYVMYSNPMLGILVFYAIPAFFAYKRSLNNNN